MRVVCRQCALVRRRCEAGIVAEELNAGAPVSKRKSLGALWQPQEPRAIVIDGARVQPLDLFLRSRRILNGL